MQGVYMHTKISRLMLVLLLSAPTTVLKSDSGSPIKGLDSQYKAIDEKYKNLGKQLEKRTDCDQVCQTELKNILENYRRIERSMCLAQSTLEGSMNQYEKDQPLGVLNADKIPEDIVEYLRFVGQIDPLNKGIIKSYNQYTGNSTVHADATPYLATDSVVITVNEEGQACLLCIERGDKLALIGGFWELGNEFADNYYDEYKQEREEYKAILVPRDDLDKYTFAFDHKDIAKEAFDYYNMDDASLINLFVANGDKPSIIEKYLSLLKMKSNFCNNADKSCQMLKAAYSIYSDKKSENNDDIFMLDVRSKILRDPRCRVVTVPGLTVISLEEYNKNS